MPSREFARVSKTPCRSQCLRGRLFGLDRGSCLYVCVLSDSILRSSSIQYSVYVAHNILRPFAYLSLTMPSRQTARPGTSNGTACKALAAIKQLVARNAFAAGCLT
jgi:hypothetical protein